MIAAPPLVSISYFLSNSKFKQLVLQFYQLASNSYNLLLINEGLLFATRSIIIIFFLYEFMYRLFLVHSHVNLRIGIPNKYAVDN